MLNCSRMLKIGAVGVRYVRLTTIFAALLTLTLDAHGYGDESGTLMLIAHTQDAVCLV